MHSFNKNVLSFFLLFFLGSIVIFQIIQPASHPAITGLPLLFVLISFILLAKKVNKKKLIYLLCFLQILITLSLLGLFFAELYVYKTIPYLNPGAKGCLIDCFSLTLIAFVVVWHYQLSPRITLASILFAPVVVCLIEKKPTPSLDSHIKRYTCIFILMGLSTLFFYLHATYPHAHSSENYKEWLADNASPTSNFIVISFNYLCYSLAGIYALLIPFLYYFRRKSYTDHEESVLFWIIFILGLFNLSLSYTLYILLYDVRINSSKEIAKKDC